MTMAMSNVTVTVTLIMTMMKLTMDDNGDDDNEHISDTHDDDTEPRVGALKLQDGWQLPAQLTKYKIINVLNYKNSSLLKT